MRDVNSMTKGAYVFENVFWSILAVFWYKRVLFTNIFDYDDDTSKWILYFTVGVFVKNPDLHTAPKR